MSLDEIDEFVKKSTILQQTISGLADGTINDKEVDLRQYGILTLEQQKEEDERKARAKEEWDRKQAEKKQREIEEERKEWWRGAEYMHGSKVLQCDDTNVCSTTIQKKGEIENRELIRKRYSVDYSRWTDKAYIPDDEATREEEQQQKDLLEKKQNDEFEKANQDWCDQVKEDIKRRQEDMKDKEQLAAKLRMKGNSFFRRKDYTTAISKYYEALKIVPYSVKILTNIAIVHEKTSCWHEAVEFCNRAVHVDSNCTKALFLRHKALLQLQDEEGALKDLNKCVSIEPGNNVFQQYLSDLSLRIKIQSVESDVNCVIKDRCSNQTSSTDEGTESRDFATLLPEKLFYIVTAEKDDLDYRSMVEKQCQYIGEFRQIFETHGITLKVRNVYPFLSMGEDITLFNLFVSLKLLKCPIACAYMRSSGYMSSLIRQLIESFKVYIECEVWKAESKDVALEVLSFITQVMKVDVAMRIFIGDSEFIESAFYMFSKHCKPIDGDLFVSLGEFLAGSLTIGWETHVQTSLLIQKDGTFLNTIFQSLKLFSSQDCHFSAHSIFKMVSSCAEMIATIASCPKLQMKVLLMTDYRGENPIMCLVSKVKLNKDNAKMTTNEIEGKEMRKSIMKALLALSAVNKMRKYFLKNSPVIRILLAISSHTNLEYESTREMALIIMMNLTTNLNCNDDKDSNQFGREIVASGCTDILIHLCLKDEKSSLIIKQRSSALLSRLVVSSLTKLDDQITQDIWKYFSKMTSSRTWIDEKMEPSTSESIATTANNLLKVYITSIEAVNSYDDIDVKVLIQLLPNPRRNSRDEIDSVSVCHPPMKANANSPSAFTSSTSSFYANILKLLILYADSNPKRHHRNILDAQGIEYLICLLANSSNYHDTVVKNASSMLARLVKVNDIAMARCRELRGMEILMQLGKSGMI